MKQFIPIIIVLAALLAVGVFLAFQVPFWGCVGLLVAAIALFIVVDNNTSEADGFIVLAGTVLTGIGVLIGMVIRTVASPATIDWVRSLFEFKGW